MTISSWSSSPATTEDASGASDSLAGFLVDDGEASNDEATFAGDGTSTGGNWGFFPEAGHASLDGLAPSVDEVLYPAPDGGE